MESLTLDGARQTGPAQEQHTTEIMTAMVGTVLCAQLNRPAKKNAMTFAMYSAIAGLLDDAAKDEGIRVVLLHGAGDSFSAGNDLDDFLHASFPMDEKSPQARFIAALINFDKPVVAAVHGAAVGSGTTMLMHCDFVYAAENTIFRMPFIDLALVPELGTSYSVPARIGYLAAAELFLLGKPFDAQRALNLGLVTRVVSDHGLMAAAMEAAQILAKKLSDALRASKRLLKRWSREQIEAAAAVEMQEYDSRLHSADTRQALTAFFEKHHPDAATARNTGDASH
ncbi:MAG TPA: enoyl-CoA hydratase-related protein [Rhizomicrobium sp.]|jgi:enoyl-CoA hydratase/carnithine racemase|nr:enoyl-CoA hydratase-related protein [Rhizomicrobium sp.]